VHAKKAALLQPSEWPSTREMTQCLAQLRAGVLMLCDITGTRTRTELDTREITTFAKDIKPGVSGSELEPDSLMVR